MLYTTPLAPRSKTFRRLYLVFGVFKDIPSLTATEIWTEEANPYFGGRLFIVSIYG